MPFRTIPNTAHRYSLIAFDADGVERNDDPDSPSGIFSETILAAAAQQPPSHVFFFSHGWKGDMPAAVEQYNRWIKAMLDLPNDIATMGPSFRPLWIGLHWPSQPWGEDELAGTSFAAGAGGPSPSELVDRYLERLNISETSKARRLLEIIVAAQQADAAATELPPQVEDAYRKLAKLAGYESKGPGGPPDADGEPFDPVATFEAGNAAGADFGGGALGGLLGPLRQLSFWTMKKRARTVGELGMHDFIAKLMQAAPRARFHLMGHSFGCIVVSSILGGPSGRKALPRPVDSVALVQGALSLWAYSDTVPGSVAPGYFNHAVKRGAVRGALITTQSTFDRAVAIFYPISVAMVAAGAEFGISLPKYGGIGSFGIQGLSNAESSPMLSEKGQYRFAPGRIYNLESSEFIKKGGGASGAHSDIDGPQVAHAIWQSALT